MEEISAPLPVWNCGRRLTQFASIVTGWMGTKGRVLCLGKEGSWGLKEAPGGVKKMQKIWTCSPEALAETTNISIIFPSKPPNQM